MSKSNMSFVEAVDTIYLIIKMNVSIIWIAELGGIILSVNIFLSEKLQFRKVLTATPVHISSMYI